MTTHPHPARRVNHPAWRVWTNPIFRRYCQSRLRARGLGVAMLATVLVCGFFVAMSESVAMARRFNPVDAARGAIIPLLVTQGLILFVLGTAQVAGGMTAERDEGVIDYQRLIPMSPLAKVLGYLFGLPVREYVCFLGTLPFTAWALWRGQVDWRHWAPLYLVLFSSTILYHFTGLLTGTVARNRRWAFLASIGLVFALYTVVPQMAKFGLVFFKYLTLSPVFMESLPGLLPKAAGDTLRVGQQFMPTVKFFNLDFSEAVFTLFSQGGLILTFVVMLCRKWRRDEAHLLGKVWACGLFAWIHFLLLGNALPLIDGGSLFPTRGFNRWTMIVRNWSPQPEEAVLMCGIYGLATLLLLFLLASIITPSADTQMRGWRRARKQGRRHLPTLSDASTAYGVVWVMALAGGAAWFVFTRAVVESRWFPGHEVPVTTAFYQAAVLLAAGLGFQALLEAQGGRFVGLVAIFAGVVPLMVGAVLSPISDRLIPVAAWIFAISPVTMPFYASGSLLTLAELPVAIARAVPRAFHFWLATSGIVTVWLSLRLYQIRRGRNAERGPKRNAE